ncbi:MAG TPA: CapA family protein [Firmicutes bacterium]|nr:CapA family protein [Bacillota bacterium]
MSDTKAQVRVIAVADLMFSGGVAARLDREADGYPFHRISGVLRQADIVFGNLETPLTDSGKSGFVRGLPRFAAPRVFAQRLAQSGFSVASLANNHILDQGYKGLMDTSSALKEVGVRTVGIISNLRQQQGPAILERKGIKVGFLAYAASCLATSTSPGAVPIEVDRIFQEVADLQTTVEHICISLHQGMEYAPRPSYRGYRLIRRLLEAGISVVLGHHPHVP